MKNVFVTGATGFIGGTVALRLVERGYHVRGLARDPVKADQLAKLGIEPVIATLDDVQILAEEARRADGVINAASADHLASLQCLVAAVEDTGKPLLHTSGTSVVGDDAKGNFSSDTIFDESTPLVVQPAKQARREIDLSVLAASSRGVRSVVICPSLVYGVGRGLNPHSVQVPFLVQQARSHGVALVVGQGLNRWSNVHIDDLADLYVLALEKAPAGSFYFAENGEASFEEIGMAIARRLGLRGVESLPAILAAERWGEARAYYTFGSNSRVRAVRARQELGWIPYHNSVVAWIDNEMVL